MFKLNPNPTFQATVQFGLPGTEDKAQIVLEFKYQTKTESEAWSAGANGKTEVEWLLEVVKGWPAGELVDADNTEIPFSAAAFTRLLDMYPGVGIAIVFAYGEELMGARRKN